MGTVRFVCGCASVLLIAVAGCGRESEPVEKPVVLTPAVEIGGVVEVRRGEAFHFTDHFRAEAASAGLPVSSDGVARLTLKGARIPALVTPAPYTIRQSVRVPGGGVLRTGFGLAPDSWDKTGGGARFLVRVHGPGGAEVLLDEEVVRWMGEDAQNWVPVELELPASEDPIEVELSTDIVGTVLGGEEGGLPGDYAVWLDPTITAGGAGDRPNIVVVLIDALRADSLGCYGYSRETSPFLDSLAARGVVFENAQSQATGTLPSMRSLLTSSYRFISGYRAGKTSPSMEADSVQLVADSMPVSLQGELRGAGYEPLACVGGGFMRAEFGFDADFGWYWTAEDVGVLPQQLTVMKERLSEMPQKPFFMLLHAYSVHDYFQGWGHCLERFDEGYLGRLSNRTELSREAILGDPKDLSAAELQYIRDMYDGEIVYTDRYLEVFFEWLLSQPWGKNTWIVVTADHGEAFGEHGVMSHGGAPYVEVAHVPLLLIPPGGGRGARRVETPVALVDLAPTLLEVAGVEAPEEMVGRSLVPALRGGELELRPILSESTLGYLMARRGDWWYLTRCDDGLEELYNTARDRAQSENLAESHGEELDDMRRVLAELSMEAVRGYRLVVSGSRSDPVVVEIESSEPLGYFAAPTLRANGAVEVGATAAEANGDVAVSLPKEVRIRVDAGDLPHVILFEGQNADSPVLVSAGVDGSEVPATRFHLGEDGVSPSSLPISLGPAARTLLTAAEPPVPSAPGDWGVWLWITPGASKPNGAQTFGPEALSEEVFQQLQSLGYLR